MIPSIDFTDTELKLNKIFVTVGSKDILALVDTGAMVSCISHAVFNELKHVEMLQTDIPLVKGVGGNSVKVLGTVQLPFTIGTQQFVYPFIVLDTITQSVILGIDFLTHHKASIELEASKMVLKSSSGDTVINFIQTEASMQAGTQVSVLRLERSVTLKPFHEYVIPVKAKSPVSGDCFLIPHDSLNKVQIAGACCVSNVANAHTVFRVMNPMAARKKLRKGTQVAIACRLNGGQTQHKLTDDQAMDVQIIETETEELCNEHMSIAEYKDIAIKLGFDTDECNLTAHQKSQLLAFLGRNRNVFATNLSELGLTHLYSHRIETGDARPIKQAPYRVCPEKKGEIEKQVKELLQNDIIEPSMSPWQSPVVLVKKKDGTYRFAVDYRKLNSVTFPISHPLPRFEDIVDAVGSSQAQFFSTLDLASGFWQIPLHPDTAHKSAFCTHSGVYAFKRLSFGMMNSPSAFSMVMSEVLRGMTFKMRWCM